MYGGRQKKGVFLTVLSFYSAANAAETPPFGRQTAPPAQHCMDIAVMSACYFCQRKAEEGGDAVASLTDDNAVLAEIASAHDCDIHAMLC